MMTNTELNSKNMPLTKEMIQSMINISITNYQNLRLREILRLATPMMTVMTKKIATETWITTKTTTHQLIPMTIETGVERKEINVRTTKRMTATMITQVHNNHAVGNPPTNKRVSKNS